MPKVPVLNNPQVKAAALPTARLSYASDSGAFGGQLADTLKQTDNVVTNIALKELADQNETRAKQLDVQFSENLRALLYSPETGYFNKRGEDAFKYRDVTAKAIDELYKKTLSEADNPSQQRLLMNALNARSQQAKLSIDRHASKEYEAWKDAASQARVNDSISEAAVSWADPKYLEVLRQSGRNEILNNGERKGLDPEVINAGLKEYDSKFYSAIVDNMMAQDVKLAEQFFNDNKDKISGPERTSLMRKLKVAKYGDLATDWGDYARLSQMAVDNPDKFAATNVDEYQLSNSHRAMFINLQRTVASNRAKLDQQVKGIGDAMRLAKASLVAAGIDTSTKASKKNKELVAQFQGALLREIETYRDNNQKRWPSEEEVKGMIDSLLLKGTYPDNRALGFILPDKSGFVFQGPDEAGNIPLVPYDEIPEADRGAIKRALEARGRAADEISIRKIYTAKKLDELRSGK